MRKSVIFLIILLSIFVTACSDDEVTPQERFDTYVDHWNEQEFPKMYKMLTSNAAETYPTKEFVDRYKKYTATWGFQT